METPPTQTESTRDCSRYNVGDVDKNCGRIINTIVGKTREVLVYVDEKNDVQWKDFLNYNPPFRSTFLARVSELEATSVFIKDHPQFYDIQCLIAQGLFLLFTRGNEADVRNVIDKAEKIILIRNREKSRRWFFISVLGFSVTALIPAASIVLYKEYRGSPPLSDTGYQVVTTALLGAIGVLASVGLRNEKLTLDANAGCALHIIEAGARVLVGITAALMFILFVKSEVVLPKLSTGPTALLWALGITAGASERILPSFIKKGEDIIAKDETKTSAHQAEHAGS